MADVSEDGFRMTRAIRDLVDEMGVALDLLTDQRGYDTARNCIRPPATDAQIRNLEAELRSSEIGWLSEFYRRANGFDLPDVCNGFFVDDVDALLRLRRRDEPVKVSGFSERTVVVFGSDGGGGRFAADLKTGELLFLPPDGAVIDHVYLDEDTDEKVRIRGQRHG